MSLNRLAIFRQYHAYNFVPNHRKVCDRDVEKLQSFLKIHNDLFVLTGAGISTESGLPDYRSKDVGLFDRSPERPVIYKNFIESEKVRKRYWARNFAGWKRFSEASPNFSHFWVAQQEKNNVVRWVVTQNVDRLHQKAGTERLIELHGCSYWVKCLNCSYNLSRFLLQQQLKELNPNFVFNTEQEIRPDCDVVLDPLSVERFVVQHCERCEGILKPDVVFFGESVPRNRVERIRSKLLESDAVLVLGSSLQVYSGYSLLLLAAEHKKPIAILNIGPTRADGIASLKIDARCGDILPRIILP